ncbi:DUF6138 family protein [Paenibacillus wulumuqiensis]|uniref:DUF6138 family protein n=1 Tax=Paenibacillus wulumuqiensis TaxID=1567107 RepID=UPI0006191797|nr:DUF6138 family protein [Paenibacillus wulumuqiensis]
MNEHVKILLEETWNQLASLALREKQRIGEFGQRSMLQVGIHDYIRVGYRKGKNNWTAGNMFVEIERPFSWSDSAYTWEPEVDVEALTDEQLLQEWLPAFRDRLKPVFEEDRWGAQYYDYKLEVGLYVERALTGDTLQHTEYWINERKRGVLREALDQFITDKVQTPPPRYPKPLDLHFFGQLLLNPDITERDTDRIIELCSRMDTKLQSIPKLRAEWDRDLLWALRTWANEQYLPHYFNNSDSYSQEHTLKPTTERPAVDPKEMELLLYAALCMGRESADERQKYLEYAAQIGSDTATRYLKEGSGDVESVRKNAYIVGKANDILQLIEIKLLTEDEAAYREALTYICDLVRQGFPREYKLKLGSKSKLLLPVKGLAKSPLHRFFAGALQYDNLHPIIADYAKLVMKEFSWYNDVEPGEKSVMPGTYGVLGLGLYSTEYFPLLTEYMQLVDTEHQMAHNSYIQAFVETHGLEPQLVPVLTAILLGSGQSARPVKGLADHWNTPELIMALDEQLAALEDYQREQLLYLICGSESKQKKFLQQANQLRAQK